MAQALTECCGVTHGFWRQTSPIPGQLHNSSILEQTIETVENGKTN